MYPSINQYQNFVKFLVYLPVNFYKASGNGLALYEHLPQVQVFLKKYFCILAPLAKLQPTKKIPAYIPNNQVGV